MLQHLTLAVSQSHTLSTTSATLHELSRIAHQAARSGAHLLLFPEAYLGGYPRTCNFGVSVGSRSDHGREQFLHHLRDAVDLGDTPDGEGDGWVEHKLPVAKGRDFRGDGTREKLEEVARNTGVFLIVGLVERAGNSLYCAVVYICPKEGCLGKRRKVMPTGTERVIWAQGSPSTLRAITTVIGGVKLTLAAAICWENYMPLLRFSLYSQNVNLYLAPTADGRDTWLPLMQTVALEGRAFVLSANQCLRRKNLPKWIANEESVTSANHKGAAKTKDVPQKPRRPSFVTKTEDNHEITWPLPGAKPPDLTEERVAEDRKSTVDGGDLEQRTPDHISAFTAEKAITTKTQDNHEIKWPPSHSIANLTNEETFNAQESAANPSPLRLGSSLADDHTDYEAKTKPRSAGSVHRQALHAKPPESHLVAIPSEETTSKSSSGSCPHATFEVPCNVPRDMADQPFQKDEEFVSRGGSCIISPSGSVLAGPLWEIESGLLFATVDFADCERGHLDFDVAGSSGRLDAFDLRVRGLDISPPPQ